MTSMIHLNDMDSTIALAAMLSSLDASGALDNHEEMVAQRVLESCLEDIPSEFVEDIDEQAADITHRIERELEARN